MITPEYCQVMARYNAWMNRRLYETCGQLSDVQRRADRGAFFKSIHSTLNHILYGDLAFLARLTGDPEHVPPLGVDLYTGFQELMQARLDIDQRIVTWADTLTQTWLEKTLTYTSKVDGNTRTVKHGLILTHMFNHQTHHRGQITTLLSQMGLDMGTTDLPFMPGLSATTESLEHGKLPKFP